MNTNFDALAFRPADILLPADADLSLWSVVACDQYTSQPEYWERVAERVGEAPSTLRLILPESALEGPHVADDIAAINKSMADYLAADAFRTYPNSLIYVERQLSDGGLRRGLVGMVDLEQYDFHPGADAQVRATEGTVLERIPPRVQVREEAPIELPHVMLLCDDPTQSVIEPLAAAKEEMEQVYDFELMESGGHITGWLLGDEQLAQVAAALTQLGNPAAFAERYQAPGQPVMTFAVGDGNHSLATAKACYEQQRDQLPSADTAELPARYALCELGNLHDESLEFEPIHRVVFGVDPAELVADLRAAYAAPVGTDATETGAGAPAADRAHVLSYAYGDTGGEVVVEDPTHQLEVGTLQAFLDKWLPEHPEARVDYIHGADVARELASGSDAVAFLLPSMAKDSLFPTVIHDGVLPRKTFSMGEAHDKRFYLEAREIR